MAKRNFYSKLRRLVRGPVGISKFPQDKPKSLRQQKAWDRFAKSSYNIYQSSLAGSGERYQRYRDYELMEYTPELASALDIYADDTTTYNENGQILDISSSDETLKSILTELYFDRLNIEYNIWNWVRNLCKYGDMFLLLEVLDKEGVVNTMPLPTVEIEREEAYDGDPNSVRYKWTYQSGAIFENWQVAHFRLLGDDIFLPYGKSILEPARRIWKQLNLIEDAMLVYRITRSPERRVFYIDVGTIPPQEVQQFVMQVKDDLKKQPIIDQSGNVDLRYNPMAVDEDYFIPVRGAVGSKVDTLPGAQNLGDIDDVRYVQNKLFAAIKVPRAYLSYESDVASKSLLSQEDIRFSRTVQRIQKIIISELTKIGIIHLYALGYDEEELSNFEIKMTNPSTITEMQKLELVGMRFDIGTKAVASQLVGTDFVREHVMGLTEQEIYNEKDKLKQDARRNAEIQEIMMAPQFAMQVDMQKATMDIQMDAQEDAMEQQMDMQQQAQQIPDQEMTPPNIAPSGTSKPANMNAANDAVSPGSDFERERFGSQKTFNMHDPDNPMSYTGPYDNDTKDVERDLMPHRKKRSYKKKSTYDRLGNPVLKSTISDVVHSQLQKDKILKQLNEAISKKKEDPKEEK
tara:strand:- start:3620 stop:5509 length:1890 start_codon:yes stop_codon:yes gene_type:complete